MLNVYIGYDPNETVAYHVLSHSILRRASCPVSIAPVMRAQLGALYTRTRGPTESTEFSFTRFLVPCLSGYTGWSLFMDCDMLCLADIAGLFALAEHAVDKAVLVCQHDYVPRSARKFLGQVQTRYARKNWSSVMLFNNALCRALTPEYVNRASGLELHQFHWAGDARIGSLPLEWNWLVGEYPWKAGVKVAHFTLGGPYFDDTRDCDYAGEWRDELEAMRFAADPGASRARTGEPGA